MMKRMIGLAVVASGVLCLPALLLYAGGGSKGDEEPKGSPKVALRAWGIDLSRYDPGKEANVSGWGGLRFRLGDKAPDGSAVCRLGGQQRNPDGEVLAHEVVVTFKNDQFPVKVDVSYQGRDMLGRPVSISGPLTLNDGLMKAIVSESSQMILLVQLSVVDE